MCAVDASRVLAKATDLMTEEKISEAIETWYSANWSAGPRLIRQERDNLARFIAQRMRTALDDERPTP